MKYFKRKEFVCKCGCGFDTVDYMLAIVLDDLRANFGVPITITSGCRCKKHNKNEGGSKNSQHISGKASDLKVKGVKPRKVFDYLDKKYPNKFGLGLYNNRIHIDVRNKKARWRV